MAWCAQRAASPDLASQGTNQLRAADPTIPLLCAQGLTLCPNRRAAHLLPSHPESLSSQLPERVAFQSLEVWKVVLRGPTPIQSQRLLPQIFLLLSISSHLKGRHLTHLSRS